MSQTQTQIGTRVWSYAGVLRDDGLSYMEYVGQLTLLLFLKMAHELTQPPYNKPNSIPKGKDSNGKAVAYDWPSFVSKDGTELYEHYRAALKHLGQQPGLLGTIFKEAECKIKDPAKLRRLIVDLIDRQTWINLDVDVKGAIYEELLARSAEESKSGAGQYFTPRELIKAIVDVMRPSPSDEIMDPAAGTGGFLTVAYDWVLQQHESQMDKDDKRRVREKLVNGQELVADTGRLCAMNLFLHGIGGRDSIPVIVGKSSLDSPPKKQFSMVLTNPPFGKQQSLKTVTEEGDVETEDEVIVREDFWTSCRNKQLNFVMHIFNLLKVGGRAAVVVPDNVLCEGGPGEKVRRNLLEKCDVHTILRLPSGIFYKPGVKANVLFFDRKPPQKEPWTSKVWIYDLRTNQHFTLKQNPITRADFNEFVAAYNPESRHKRTESWSAANPEGRWRVFDYAELNKRDKLNLDIFWLKDESLEDSDSLPDPDVLAAEIVDDLQAALDAFAGIASALGKKGGRTGGQPPTTGPNEATGG